MEGDQGKRSEQIRARLAQLGEERRQLLGELLSSEAARGQQELSPATEPVPRTPLEKIGLFRKRFVARSDVYPVFWENRSKGTQGYYPACESVFENGVRLRPTELYARFGPSKFRRLDDRALKDHLTGRQTIGTYAIRADDTCLFLAADFDGVGWQESVSAYVDAASDLGFDLLVEISRSGNGAHAWLFFAEAVSAYLARALGTCFLTEASSRVSKLNLDSYDRFFPNQDKLPKGGFGNLIGLPLQRKLRELGRTVFVDAGFSPLADQWQALAEVPGYWQHHARSAVESYAEVSPIEDAAPGEIEEACLSVSSKRESVGQKRVPDRRAELRKSLSIPTTGLPDEFVAKLMSLATFPNPEYFEKQRLRFPVFNIPRYIVGFEKTKVTLSLPRGILEEAIELFESRGSRLEVEDLRLNGRGIRVRFTGTLSPAQRHAVNSLEGKDCGVVVAPPGAGKTVIACSLIGQWKLTTVILVNRRSIAKQWRERLLEFTSLSEERIGTWGGGRARLCKTVDIVMLQSLSRAGNVAEFFRDYSAVFIDECHHVPAVTFDAIMKECGCRKIVGLTATPKRKDGLEKLLFQQCGPIRHVSEEDPDPDLKKSLHLVTTNFDLRQGEDRYWPLHEIWEKLVEDASRNQLIVSRIVKQLAEGRRCIVLSDRLAHLGRLEEMAKRQELPEPVLFETMVGGRSEAALAQQEKRLSEGLAAGSAACVFATGSFLGEGYDRKEFDTLFLCMPMSFKGRIVQYAGRLHRRFEPKKEARVFDFLDSRLPVAMSMWRKRRGAYREMGYEEVERP